MLELSEVYGDFRLRDFRLREPEEYYLRAMSEKLGFIELSSWALIKLLVGVLLSVFPELALCCLSQW